jgi:type I restriction enzyme S subunit
MVVVGRKGSIGEVHYAPDGGWPIDTTFYVTGAPHRNIRYTYYLLKFLDLTSMNFDSAVPGLNRDAAHARPVDIPDIAGQAAIAAVLGALDDKIENCRIVTEAADRLRTARFELLLEDQDLEKRPLSDLARFVNGRNFTKGASGSGRMVVRIAELNRGPGRSTVFNDVEAREDCTARPGDLLFAWSGSLTVRRWYRDEAVVNQHIFKVIPNQSWPRWFLHGQLLRLLPWFRQEAANKATTMGHIQRRHLDEPVLMPVRASLCLADRLCAPLWERALAAEQESVALAKLRDALLPALMSGELRVREASAPHPRGGGGVTAAEFAD